MKKLFKILSLILALNIFASSQSSAGFIFNDCPVCPITCDICPERIKDLAPLLAKKLWSLSKTLASGKAKDKCAEGFNVVYNMNAPELKEFIKHAAIIFKDYGYDHPILYAFIATGIISSMYCRNGVKKIIGMTPPVWLWNKLRNKDKIDQLKSTHGTQREILKNTSNILKTLCSKNTNKGKGKDGQPSENLMDKIQEIQGILGKLKAAQTETSVDPTIQQHNIVNVGGVSTPKATDTRLFLEKVGSSIGGYIGRLAQPQSFSGVATRTVLTAGTIGAGTAIAKYYFNLF